MKGDIEKRGLALKRKIHSWEVGNGIHVLKQKKWRLPGQRKRPAEHNEHGETNEGEEEMKTNYRGIHIERHRDETPYFVLCTPPPK